MLQTLKSIEENDLNSQIGVLFEKPALRVSDSHGAQNGGDITLTVHTNNIIDFETKLITNIN